MSWAIRRGDVEIRDSVNEDVLSLKDRLRKSDAEEVWAATHQTPEAALIDGRRISPLCKTVLLRGIPVAMFGVGVIPDQDSVCSGWFLATDDLNTMRPSFLRLSKECIHRMLNVCPVMVNWVDARNKASIKWLEWCGADVSTPEPFGFDNQPFHFFVLRRS